MSFVDWQWLFPIAIALHNLEEAIWLPAWSQQAGKWHRPVNPPAFRFAVAVLTAMAFGVTLWSARAGSGSVGAYLLAGYAVAMLLNVLMPHLVATVALRRYMPGLATALTLNLPVTIFLLQQALAEGYVTFPMVAYVGVFVSVALVAAIPVLFAVGEKLMGRSMGHRWKANGLFALVGQIAVVFIFGMGWSNNVFGSFVPSLILLVILLLASCGVLALLKESPLMAAKRSA